MRKTNRNSPVSKRVELSNSSLLIVIIFSDLLTEQHTYTHTSRCIQLTSTPSHDLFNRHGNRLCVYAIRWSSSLWTVILTQVYLCYHFFSKKPLRPFCYVEDQTSERREHRFSMVDRCRPMALRFVICPEVALHLGFSRTFESIR